MKILFLGAVFKDEYVAEFGSVNQAAQNWTKGFLSPFYNIDNEITTVSFKNERLFPRGSFYVVSKKQYFKHFSNVVTVSYLNIPVLRKYFLALGYIWTVSRLLFNRDFEVLFCYNLYKWHTSVFRWVKYINPNCKIIPIILDEDDPNIDSWRKFNKLTKFTDGLIFLSYWGFQNYPGNKPKLHLDSGSNHWYDQNVNNRSGRKILLYAGKYQETYGGLKSLSEIIHVLSEFVDVRLSGKASLKMIEKYFGNNKNVKYLGFLSDDELHKYCLEADIYLNYRPSDNADNKMIFPSKIIHYLSYGKPVISNFTPGLDPIYSEFLYVPKTESPEDFLFVLHQVLGLDDITWQVKREKQKKWFLENKTWNSHYLRLRLWLENSVNR